MSGNKKLKRMAGSKLEDQLSFALYSASLAMTKAYKPMLDRLGLTYSQYLAMLVLWECDDVPVSHLSTRLGLDSGTLTPLLKRLENMGLVRRRRGEEDERQVFIELTARGVSLKRDARLLPSKVLAESSQAEAEKTALRIQLIALRNSLNAS